MQEEGRRWKESFSSKKRWKESFTSKKDGRKVRGS
jgi:hypothetical protein